MSGSLYAAISGLDASQALLGVVSENIANANTVGYKASTANFAQAIQETLSGGSSPTAQVGGINPEQLAAGGAVNIAQVAVNMGQGSLQTTGVTTNLAVQGAGFFVVSLPQGGYAYTRAGDFTLDAKGDLVNPEGYRVMGWSGATVQSGTQAPTNLVPLTVLPGQTMNPQASTTFSVTGNLNSADTANPALVETTPLMLYDSLGNPQNITLDFANPTVPAGGGVQWTVQYTPKGGTAQTLGTLTFNSNGTFQSFTQSGTINLTPTDGAAPIAITPTAQDFSSMTGFASTTQLQATANGNAAGVLENYTIGASGVITGSFSNGLTQPLGQVALANFNNAAGLLNIGNTLWQQSANSGNALIGPANSGSLGSLATGTLEGANVNLANEFVNMIIAQQGYQANAKVITVAQTLRTTLNNMIA